MKKVELLSPAGNYEAFLGAVNAGADAVYLGGEKYGARAYADNFSDEEIINAIRYAHLWNKKVYLTINTLMKEEECKDLESYITPFYQAGLDGVIVQDLGAFKLLKERFEDLELHASTQMTLTGSLGVSLLKEMGACRVVPARELSLNEIKEIKKKIDIEIECFVHGAMCYCYSGQCLFSSILGGRSGNRGRCAQPCRLPYKLSENGKGSYPFSLKDMCTISFIPKLIESGIDSFKIEGRMKKPEYAAGVTAIYRKYIDLYYEKGGKDYHIIKEDMDNLSKLYIRSEIQEGYYFRHNGKEMVTLSKPSYSGSDETYLKKIRKTYIENSPKMRIYMEGKFVQGESAFLLAGYQDITVSVQGEVVDKAKKSPMNEEDIKKQLMKLGNTAFECEDFSLTVQKDCFIPNKILNELRRNVLSALEDAIIKKNGFVLHRTVKEGTFSSQTAYHLSKKDVKDEYAVMLSKKGQLDIFSKQNYEKINRLYLEYGLFLSLQTKEVEQLKERFRIGVLYPRIIRKKDRSLLEELYEKSEQLPFILVDNLETLQFLIKKGYKGEIVCNYTIYMFNSESILQIQKQAQGICYPVELNKKELMQICMPKEMHCEQLMYSYLPLMVSANCIKKTSDKCTQQGKITKVYDRYQKAFFVAEDCRMCYNRIYNCVPLSLHNYEKEMKHKIDIKRLDFTIEDGKMTKEILDFYLTEQKADFPLEYTTGHYKRGVL